MAASPVRGVYETMIDRESAEEVLAARRGEADQATADAKLAEAKAKTDALAAKDAEKAATARAKEDARLDREAARPRPAARRSTRQTPVEALTKSVLRTAGSTLTRELMRGLLGGLKRR